MQKCSAKETIIQHKIQNAKRLSSDMSLCHFIAHIPLLVPHFRSPTRICTRTETVSIKQFNRNSYIWNRSHVANTCVSGAFGTHIYNTTFIYCDGSLKALNHVAVLVSVSFAYIYRTMDGCVKAIIFRMPRRMMKLPAKSRFGYCCLLHSASTIFFIFCFVCLFSVLFFWSIQCSESIFFEPKVVCLNLTDFFCFSYAHLRCALYPYCKSVFVSYTRLLIFPEYIFPLAATSQSNFF